MFRIRFLNAFFVLVSLLSACQSGSYDGFKEKGKSETRLLIRTLKMIKTKDQLVENQQEIKRHFKNLGELHKNVQLYASLHPQEELPALNSQDHALSEELRAEILRVYRLDGGREIINLCRSLPK